MRGTVVPDSELRLAEEFLDKVQLGDRHQVHTIRREDLIRLLAWFGAIRRDWGNSETLHVKFTPADEECAKEPRRLIEIEQQQDSTK
ncbi:MAG: hypothetical protein ACKVQA_25395 [Burkholderiales bacterium]